MVQLEQTNNEELESFLEITIMYLSIQVDLNIMHVKVLMETSKSVASDFALCQNIMCKNSIIKLFHLTRH